MPRMTPPIAIKCCFCVWWRSTAVTPPVSGVRARSHRTSFVPAKAANVARHYPKCVAAPRRLDGRSEERRVGKEGRSRWAGDGEEKTGEETASEARREVRQKAGG